jgi:hypothetical protein
LGSASYNDAAPHGAGGDGRGDVSGPAGRPVHGNCGAFTAPGSSASQGLRAGTGSVIYTPMKRLPHGWLSGLWLAAGLMLRTGAAEPAGEWISLFNGKDLTGWVKMHEVQAEVRDGLLHIGKGMGWLRTEREFSDFVLEFEWRALEDKYDSGLFFRAGLEGKPWPDKSYQVNLRYDMLGGLVKGFTPVVPAETPKMPLNQWVKFRLEARGNRVSLDVNGERAWETDKVEPGRGYLGIQIEDRAFDFRNLRVKDLGPAAK